jgi:hypothetical protein
MSDQIIVSTVVRELIFPLSGYSKVLNVKGSAAATVEHIRIMPGVNFPLQSAVVGARRRALTEAEMSVVLKHPQMARLTDQGKVRVVGKLSELSVTERIGLTTATSDKTVLEKWLGMETDDNVKAGLVAQLAEISEKRIEGDYRDVKDAQRKIVASNPLEMPSF